MSGERGGKTGENIDIKLWHLDENVTDIEPFARIEVKKVGGLDNSAKNQIKNETLRFGNVILTDNLEWWFYHIENSETKMYTGVKLIELQGGTLTLLRDNMPLFISLLEDFLLKDPTQIKSSKRLAQYMATRR